MLTRTEAQKEPEAPEQCLCPLLLECWVHTQIPAILASLGPSPTHHKEARQGPAQQALLHHQALE